MELRVLLSKKDSLSDRSNLKQRHKQLSGELSVCFRIGWSSNPEGSLTAESSPTADST